MSLPNHHAAGSPGRKILLLSVLALLAFSSFSASALADSSGIQYQDAPPTVAGGDASQGSGPYGQSSDASQDGGSGPGATSEGGGGESGDQGSAGAAGNESDGGISGVGPGKALPGTGTENASEAASHAGSGSSPLAPILIAIAVLAAISLAAVMIRQRRREGQSVKGKSTGSSVRPEAG